jgi:hypothetical protein
MFGFTTLKGKHTHSQINAPDALTKKAWCLGPFSTIFQLYHGGQFYWWRKAECSEKCVFTFLSSTCNLHYKSKHIEEQ